MPLSCREDDHAITRGTRLEGIKELNARPARSKQASRIATVAPALIWGATYSQGNGAFGGRLCSPHHSVSRRNGHVGIVRNRLVVVGGVRLQRICFGELGIARA